jgi:dipeptidyl aminopeptidase/acylaminoacyl peptidase
LAGVVAVVPATGGSLTPLTVLDEAAGDLAHVWPQVLPGGNFLYWTPSSKAENTATIYGASIKMPNERVALVRSETRAVYATDAKGIGYLLWQRNGALMAQTFDGATLKFSGEPREIADSVGTTGGNADVWTAASSVGSLVYSAPELERMTWFERSGKTVGTLGEPGLFFVNARFSHDGKHVAASRIDVARDLWLFDVERGTSRRTTFDSLGGLAAQWSPDGRTILFMGNNTTALYRKDASGGTPDERLASWDGNDYILTDWSRDGRSVLNNRITQDTKADIWVVPVTPDGHLDASAQPRPYLRTPVNESTARFFPEPNPRWVAYQSDENGRDEIYAQAFPAPQGPHRISTNGGTRPTWGPGGKELFYQSPDNKVMVVSITPRSQTLEVSAPRELFALPPVSRFEVAPDGQRFLVTMQEQRPQPLTVIVNWPALMK